MNYFKKIFIIGILVFSISCDEKKSDETTDDGNSSSTIGSTPGTLAISELSNLPNVTDPVLQLDGDTEEQSFDSPAGTLDISLDLLATEQQGVSIGSNTESTYFDSVQNASYGSCEMVNRMRGILQEAASADYQLCDFRTFLGMNEISTDFIDGDEHIISIEEDGEEVDRFKIKITEKNDKVVEFIFHSCEEGKQTHYIRKAIDDDNNVTILTKRANGVDDSGPQRISYTSRTVVTGKVNSEGKYVGLKTMVQTYSNDFNSDGTDVSYNKYKVIQSDENIALLGFATQTTKSDPDQIMAFFELVDKNVDGSTYNLKNLAIGAGAFLLKDGSTSYEQGWSGGGAIDASSPWIPKVAGKEQDLPTPPANESEQEDLSFSGDEAWDCSGDAEVIIDESEEDDSLDEACTQYELPQSQSSHLECHNYR
ncbi:MAG: hypothetical protein R3B45_14760 [Bdellovibrionota bacterium]